MDPRALQLELEEKGYVLIKSFYSLGDIRALNKKIIGIINIVLNHFLGFKSALLRK